MVGKHISSNGGLLNRLLWWWLNYVAICRNLALCSVRIKYTTSLPGQMLTYWQSTLHKWQCIWGRAFFMQENAFKNVISQMLVNWSRPRCVNMSLFGQAQPLNLGLNRCQLCIFCIIMNLQHSCVWYVAIAWGDMLNSVSKIVKLTVHEQSGYRFPRAP